MAHTTGMRVVVEWQDGKTAPATVVAYGAGNITLVFDHEPGEEYAFEQSVNRADWFELNNSDTPVSITPVP
jgi:hypothetical protein